MPPLPPLPPLPPPLPRRPGGAEPSRRSTGCRAACAHARAAARRGLPAAAAAMCCCGDGRGGCRNRPPARGQPSIASISVGCSCCAQAALAGCRLRSRVHARRRGLQEAQVPALGGLHMRLNAHEGPCMRCIARVQQATRRSTIVFLNSHRRVHITIPSCTSLPLPAPHLTPATMLCTASARLVTAPLGRSAGARLQRAARVQRRL